MGRTLERAEEAKNSFDLQMFAFKNEVLSGIKLEKFEAGVFDYSDPGMLMELKADYSYADQKTKNALIKRHEKLVELFTDMHRLLLEYRETVGKEDEAFGKMAKSLVIIIKFLSWLVYIKT